MNFKSFKIRWVIALSFALIITLAIIFNITSIHGIARAAMSPTIVSDMADYSPGSTVNLTGAGWASGESVHIYVNDSVGNTWNLNSNPDPVADANGGFTYSFSLPNSFIANYTVMATGATSGTATMTFTDSNCPSLSGKVQSNLVGASSTTSGNTLTYTFSSVSETQTELGVPGLIDYCVYPTGSSPLLPDNSNVNNVQATGANGFAWVYDTGTNNFSFHRKDGGNADNIPLDGKTVTMGTATWSGSVPTGQTILLHINDAAECDKLYGGNPGTCFVLPGNPQQQAKDLTVSKTATPSFTRTYNWDIKKSVDPTERKIADGGTATFSYTVDVNETGFTDSAWKVTGTITVSNPNGFEDIVANVSDAVDNGGGDICIVTGGSNVKVPHSGSVNLDYSCTYPSSGPTSSSGTNTATASWDKTAASTPTGKAQGTKTFDFTTPTTTVNKTISVTDSYKGTLGTLTATDSTPFASQTFTYTRTETGTAGTCKTYPNTATIKETGQTADASVQLCVGADLTVSKTATPSFTRTFKWGITKSVDQTQQNIAAGGTATFKYTVSVTHDSGKDSGWTVSGKITVSNPNDWEDIPLTGITDAVDNGATSCTFTNGSTTAAVPAGGSVTLDYTCTYTSAPSKSSGTNTATATWNKDTYFTPDGSASSDPVPFAFTTPTTVVDGSVTVTDTLGGTLGTVKSSDPSPTTFIYSHTFSGDPAGTCTSHDNTATIVETTGSASQPVKVCVGADLQVAKDATPSFTRTFKWGITKEVDQTLIKQSGVTATFNYTVKVTHDPGTDSAWQVTGQITVTNPNEWEAITADVTDAVDNGGTCSVSGGTGVSVPASGTKTLNYTCTYASAPSPSSGTNTATASWDKNAASTLDGSASGSADFTFVAPTTVVDGSVTVTDSLADPSTLGTVSSTDKSPTTFTYSHMVTGTPGTCVSQDNTATFTTNTSGTKGLDSKSVQLCVAVDLTVSKVAIPSFTRTYSWGITKDVDQTKVTNSSGSATFKYTVNVTHDGGTDSGWQVTGKITVSNPNHFESISKVQVTDTLDNGGTCVIDTSAFNGTLGPNESTDLPYTCTYLSSGPTSKSGTNTATVIWDQQAASTKDGSASKDVPFAFDTGDQGNPTVIDGSVTVTDSLGGTLGTVKSSNPSPTSFTYSRTVIGTPGKCVTQDNKATFTTNTYGTTGSASKSVQLCVGADLTVSKVAIPSFTRTYNWSIAKNVDKTLVEQTGGGTATFNYTVNVNETGFTDSKWMVSGTITVSNPNDFEDVTGVNVTDAINNGGTCTVTNGTNLTIAAGGAPVTLDYTCNYASAPSPLTGGTNTATAKWDQTKAFTPSGNASGMTNVDFEGPTSEVNKTIAVTDTFNGATNTLGTLTATGTKPFTTKTYTYSRTVTVPTTNCVKYTNTAKIVETGQSASQTIEVCGPANTGALTMGFWQNKNGQGIIAKSGPSSGTCALTTWLRQYAPFQDLSATAPCGSVGSTSNNDVVGYVYNIIKAANASGSSMNAMLKAQMLATALDVYFGGGPGGNPINAPKPPIGSVSIDLTLICKVADSSSGTSNCSGSYNDVRSAFGVVPPTTSLTVSQMLTYAASQSNAGGLTWYGNVKATQEMAKNAFDAINNQVAFAP